MGIIYIKWSISHSPLTSLSCSVAKSYSDSLQPHGLQQASLLCPPLSPGVCSNSCPLSWWCYLTTSFAATLFSFCLQSFPASESFPVLLYLVVIFFLLWGLFDLFFLENINVRKVILFFLCYWFFPCFGINCWILYNPINMTLIRVRLV